MHTHISTNIYTYNTFLKSWLDFLLVKIRLSLTRACLFPSTPVRTYLHPHLLLSMKDQACLQKGHI